MDKYIKIVYQNYFFFTFLPLKPISVHCAAQVLQCKSYE